MLSQRHLSVKANSILQPGRMVFIASMLWKDNRFGTMEMFTLTCPPSSITEGSILEQAMVITKFLRLMQKQVLKFGQRRCLILCGAAPAQVTISSFLDSEEVTFPRVPRYRRAKPSRLTQKRGASCGSMKPKTLSSRQSPFRTTLSFLVRAMDTSIASTQWTGNLIGKRISVGPVVSSPAVTPEVIYAAAKNGYIYALSADSGKMLWEFDTRTVTRKIEFYSSPAVANGLLYIGSSDRYIFCLGGDVPGGTIGNR